MIDLPSNIVWLDGGRLGVAIMQGDERRPDWWDESSVEFVAPQAWAQYDKRFDPPFVLAGRKTFAVDPTSDDNGLREVDSDGRQVWDVRWPCEACGCDRNSASTCGVEDCFGGYLSARATIRCFYVDGDDMTELTLAPLPTPGHDFAVIVRIQE